MQLHEIKPKTERKAAKRIGRGGKRGKTSGRGGKGQTARAGGAPRPEMRDIIKKLPKRRGYGKNRARTVNAGRVRPVIVHLTDFERAFEDGAKITPKTLTTAGVISTVRGRVPSVKLLGDGALTKKFAVSDIELSASARQKIESAGGTIA